MRSFWRRCAPVIALLAVVATAACAQARPVDFSPPPPPTAVAEAQTYARDHSPDPVKYTDESKGFNPDQWVRGVVLQTGVGVSASEGPKWKAYVIWPDGHKDVIAAVGNDTDTMNLSVHPGDYIAYSRPYGGALDTESLIVITPAAVPSVLRQSSSATPSVGPTV